jgi:hypothetical protein
MEDYRLKKIIKRVLLEEPAAPSPTAEEPKDWYVAVPVSPEAPKGWIAVSMKDIKTKIDAKEITTDSQVYNKDATGGKWSPIKYVQSVMEKINTGTPPTPPTQETQGTDQTAKTNTQTMEQYCPSAAKMKNANIKKLEQTIESQIEDTDDVNQQQQINKTFKKQLKKYLGDFSTTCLGELKKTQTDPNLIAKFTEMNKKWYEKDNVKKLLGSVGEFALKKITDVVNKKMSGATNESYLKKIVNKNLNELYYRKKRNIR